MSWYLIYKTATGVLVSDTSMAPDSADQTAMGNSIATVSNRPDWETQVWNETTHAVDDKPVAVVSIFSAVGGPFAQWQVWKTTHEAFVTNLESTALINGAADQADAAYTAYKAAVTVALGL